MNRVNLEIVVVNISVLILDFWNNFNVFTKDIGEIFRIAILMQHLPSETTPHIFMK